MATNTLSVQTTTTICDKDKIILDDKCGSHHYIDVLEVPKYLLDPENKTFETMAQQKIYGSTSSINIEQLKQITILFHQWTIIDLEKSLWNMFLKCGTGNISQSTLKVWPTCLKSMIQLSKRITTISDINQIQINDSVYINFIQENLNQLNEKERQIQQQLLEKQKQFHGYTNRIETHLRTYVQQHLHILHLQYESKRKYIELFYQEQVNEYNFQQYKPTEQQKQLMKILLNHKYQYEEAKQEVRFMKQHILNNKLPKSFDSIQQIPLPATIQTLTNLDLCQQLKDRYDNTMNEYKEEMIKIYRETVEIKLNDTKKLFDDEMTQFWHHYHLLPSYQRMNKNMIELMDQRFTIIMNKLECVYNYKLQQLHIKY